MKKVDKYLEWNENLKHGLLPVASLLKKYHYGHWVIDVGSNIGSFIETVIEQCPTANILAFEPVERYYNYSTAKFSGNKRVQIENIALGDRNEEIIIYTADKNIGWNTIIKEKVDEDNSSNEQRIQCVPFDWYWKKEQLDIEVDILKIDVEGYEYKVLAGMKQFLKEQHPTIFCEIGWGKGHPYWKQELEMFEYLFSIGYDRSIESLIKKLEVTTDVVFQYKG